MSEIPKRPRAKDYEVRRLAAERAIQPIIEWSETPLETINKEYFIEDLVSAFCKSTDAYAICRHLEHECGWQGRFEPDTELVFILDEPFVNVAESELVQEWVAAHHPMPSRKIGDQVVFNWTGGTWTAGIIKDIYGHIAVYLVSIEHLDAIALVPYEDARLLPREETEQAGLAATLPDMGVQTNILE